MTDASKAEPLMIAHAGGGFQGVAYSNSIEALDNSYRQGFRYIEMDFSWTNDGQLVCLHDWDKTYKKLFKQKTKAPLSRKKFEQMVAQHPTFRSCTLVTLVDWLADKPQVRIITDIKDDNLIGITHIIAQYPEIKDQLIPQFYQPEEYNVLKKKGFEDLIWILYQYKGSKQSVLDEAENMDLFAVSMRSRQAKSRTLQKLRQGHRIFVYTINKKSSIKRLSDKYGVSGFYTDFLVAE
ncbi:glycerophosphodiester phosphodiesterase family protein [Marinicella sp. X102]|nr:glycerophosphodiester phosphodiesterase family protein [Marinicella marina]